MGGNLIMAASVTRILELSGFDSKVKTRDIHAAFADLGAPKVKWIDDHSLYLVFSDAATAKRVFLQCLGSIPFQITPAPNSSVQLKPYKGSDGQAIIAYTQRVGPRSERTNSIASQDAAMSLANGSVSPAVSMLLLAAAVANGPPGTLGGSFNGMHYPSMHQQQFNGHSFPTSHSSNGSIHSSYSQGSNIIDPFSFGYSMSGPLNGPLSTSSSWSDTSSVSNNRINSRGGSISLQPNPFPMSRSGLENIAEASSREELSHSQMAHAPQEDLASIFITESTPLAGAAMGEQQARAMEGIRTPSPQGKPSSATEESGVPWLSREPSPTPSMPNLRKESPINELVDAANRLMIHDGRDVGEVSSESEKLSETAFNRGISTPPDGGMSPGKTSTPPRVGNPAKRMLGHALGIRHPSLPPRVIAGTTSN